ncbi:MAG TPA: MerR family transcriptional regulator [Candidatus Limnocylindrales bacterium]|nr:MerR family transcriptional regulator [Candidatus Limnocylindrales bacterium]
MYTIKEAAARTGLSVPVLRAWERRYGVVSPTRTPGGYRVYDEAALARLRSMRRLIEDGWSASAAAAAVVASGPGQVATPPAAPGGVDRFGDARLSEQLVAAAAAIDSDEIEAVLDDMFATGSYERVVGDHLVPALRAVGDGWAEGRVAVAGEHVASSAVLRRLAAAFQAASAGPAGERPVLVGLPPGARHELGGLIFATAARRAGLPVVYLGADLPIGDWIAAVERTDARAVVIGAVMASDTAPARSVAAELAAVRPALTIAFGGPAAPEAGIPAGSIRLPEETPDAVAALREALD